MCGPRDESITHLIYQSQNPQNQPKKDYKNQHDRNNKNETIQLCLKLCQKFNINHTPENILENETVPKRAKLINTNTSTLC